jgi:hypothetical protein
VVVRQQEGSLVMLWLGMLALGLLAFAGMVKFLDLCERV